MKCLRFRSMPTTWKKVSSPIQSPCISHTIGIPHKKYQKFFLTALSLSIALNACHISYGNIGCKTNIYHKHYISNNWKKNECASCSSKHTQGIYSPSGSMVRLAVDGFLWKYDFRLFVGQSSHNSNSSSSVSLLESLLNAFPSP